MCYNGNGDVLEPVIIHNGQITDKVEQNFEHAITFVHTRNAQLNYDTSVKILELIEGYLKSS